MLTTPARQARIELRLQWFIRWAFRHKDSLRLLLSLHYPNQRDRNASGRYAAAESWPRGNRIVTIADVSGIAEFRLD